LARLASTSAAATWWLRPVPATARSGCSGSTPGHRPHRWGSGCRPDGVDLPGFAILEERDLSQTARGPPREAM
jgi:hypothetical protein